MSNPVCSTCGAVVPYDQPSVAPDDTPRRLQSEMAMFSFDYVNGLRAEVSRLREERQVWKANYVELSEQHQALNLKAESEVARLREELSRSPVSAPSLTTSEGAGSLPRVGPSEGDSGLSYSAGSTNPDFDVWWTAFQAGLSRLDRMMLALAAYSAGAQRATQDAQELRGEVSRLQQALQQSEKDAESHLERANREIGKRQQYQIQYTRQMEVELRLRQKCEQAEADLAAAQARIAELEAKIALA